ncbi:uncharacterized protein SETTUDRAFT_105516, partial [Exserohilum turcica Et28A]
DRDSWRTLLRLFDVAVLDRLTAAAKELRQALHSLLQVNNKILHHENTNLREVLAIKNYLKKQKKPLELQQSKQYYTPAVVWSPRTIEDARAQERQKNTKKSLKNSKKRETTGTSC